MQTNRKAAPESRESSRHPSQDELIRFGRRIFSPKTIDSLDDHLVACEYCQGRLAAIPAPVSYALGRPFPGAELASPSTLEDLVRDFTRHLEHGRTSGAPIHVAGDWTSEKLLYQCIAIATSRLWRGGYSVELRGGIFAGAKMPSRPDSDIAVLLEAPIFGSRLSEWLRPEPGRIVVLVGHVADWEQAGMAVQFRPSTAETSASIDRVVQHVKALANRGNHESELAYLNASGVDLPETAIADPTNPDCPFVPLQDSRGYPLPFRSMDVGQWLARDVLGQLPLEHLKPILERRVPEIDRAAIIARLRTRSNQGRMREL